MQTRNTVQRQIVLQAVRSLHDHPTADSVYAVIAAEHPSISKATVYRNLVSDSQPHYSAKSCAFRCRRALTASISTRRSIIMCAAPNAAMSTMYSCRPSPTCLTA